MNVGGLGERGSCDEKKKQTTEQSVRRPLGERRIYSLGFVWAMLGSARTIYFDVMF